MNRRSMGIAHRAIQVMAISLALLLFSVIGTVAMLTAAHANGQTQTSANDTPVTSPILTTVPTYTPTPNPTPSPTPGPTPTPSPTPNPTPAPVPGNTPPPATQIPNPTPVPTTVSNGGNPPPGMAATPTSAAVGVGNASPTPTATKGTPTATKTAMGTPTANAQSTTAPGSTNYDTPAATPTSADRMMTSLTGPIVGASSIVILSTVSLIGLAMWKRRKAQTVQEPEGVAMPQTQAAPVQAQGPWMDWLKVAPHFNNYYAQPTDFSPADHAAHTVAIPSAMQSIAQYSPLLGAPNSSMLDAPTPPPTSDFRPLPIDYPQIIETTTTDREPRHTPLAQTVPPNMTIGYRHPALKSAPMQPPSTPAQPQTSPLQRDIDEVPTTPPTLSPTYQEPQSDPFLEAMMHQAQMGIFALPGKDN